MAPHGSVSGFDLMTVLFLELAETCAPTMSSDILAAVVSMESGFAPLAIRINSDHRNADLPRNVAEAAESAARLITAGQSIDLGLGAVSPSDLESMGMSIADGFDPCTNLKATAQLLKQYRIAAHRAGFQETELDAVMVRAYFGRGEPRIGEIVGYDHRVEEERRRLKPRLADLALNDAPAGVFLPPHRTPHGGDIDPMPNENVSLDGAKNALRVQPLAPGVGGNWDVFGSKAASSVLVFSEQ